MMWLGDSKKSSFLAPHCKWNIQEYDGSIPPNHLIIVSCLSNPVEPSMFDGESTRF